MFRRPQARQPPRDDLRIVDAEELYEFGMQGRLRLNLPG